MKKGILLLTMITTLAAGSAFGWGIGASYNLNFLDSATPGAALTFKLDNLPLISIAGRFGSNLLSLGLTADWWLYQQALGGTSVNLYAGVGGYGSLTMFGNNAYLDGGVRVPIGINIFPVKFLELFVEIAPALGITLSDPIVFPNFGVQGAFGLRFWFK